MKKTVERRGRFLFVINMSELNAIESNHYIYKDVLMLYDMSVLPIMAYAQTSEGCVTHSYPDCGRRPFCHPATMHC